VAAYIEIGSKIGQALANAAGLGHAAHVPAAVEAPSETQESARAEPSAVVLHVRGPARLPCVDALRGVMALCVAAYHFASLTHAFTPGGRIASAIAWLGIYSVQGFFILSGLCFFHAYRGQRVDLPEAKRFYIRRFFRIAPLYYAVLALNLALGQAVWPRFSWGRIAENVTLSFGLFHPNHAMVLGGWSIGIECVFYLCFPFLLWLCHGRALLLALLVALGALPFLLEDSLRTAPEAARFHAYVRIPNHAFLFLLGALCAEWVARVRLRIPGLLLLALVFVCAAFSVTHSAPVYDHFALMLGAPRALGVGVCFALTLLCASGRITRPRLFAPFRVLGELSYAVYLVHPFAFQLLSSLGLSKREPRLVFMAALALSLLLAQLVHSLLEKPLLAWGRRLSEPLPREGHALSASARNPGRAFPQRPRTLRAPPAT
jgi:peptidoglycan/LPS O-acetylase OafA/YrhL